MLFCIFAANITLRPHNMRTPIALTFVSLLLAACSSQQLYATGRNAQRTECMKQADGDARDRCLKDAGMSHDAYQKEVDAARK
jgi:hypothetical protein